MSTTINNLEEALVEELKDIYSAEQQLIEALPLMAKAAHDPQLKKGFEQHLQQTKEQAERLEQVFSLLGQKAQAHTCQAMKGLVREANELIAEKADPNVHDALLIAGGQKVEHYEIASYGTVITWAKTLGRNDVADLLSETLQEEKETDQKLTEAAEKLNAVAA
jgi:ferritin-like metal-binding protein YciE